MTEYRLEQIYDFDCYRAKLYHPDFAETHPGFVVKTYPPQGDFAVHPDGLILQEIIDAVQVTATKGKRLADLGFAKGFVHLAAYFDNPANAEKISLTLKEVEERGLQQGARARAAETQKAAASAASLA